MEIIHQGTEREREAALLVSEAMSVVIEIAEARRQGYADYPANPQRGRLETRPMTMKDAKQRARYAEKLLRQAWDILDPPLAN